MAKRIAEVEARIHELESRLESLTEAINQSSAAGEARRVAELGAAYTQAEADLHAAMAEWEGLLES